MPEPVHGPAGKAGLKRWAAKGQTRPARGRRGVGGRGNAANKSLMVESERFCVIFDRVERAELLHREHSRVYQRGRAAVPNNFAFSVFFGARPALHTYAPMLYIYSHETHCNPCSSSFRKWLMKTLRHNAIRELVAASLVANQDELRRKLRRRGFAVTQATLSRDIHELRLSKALAAIPC